MLQTKEGPGLTRLLQATALLRLGFMLGPAGAQCLRCDVRREIMKHTLDYKVAPKYSTYRYRHRQRHGDSPVISESDFRDISSRACHCCGVEGPNGIDRVDSQNGYEKDNCVPCRKHCNYVKGNLSAPDFEKWARRFVCHQSQLRSRTRRSTVSVRPTPSTHGSGVG